MARLQKHDFNSRRAQIKARSTHLFARKGFHGTSIIDIAKACHTVKSRLYYYFPSKQQLFFEILEDHAAHLTQTLLPILDSKLATNARQKLENYAAALLALNVQYRDQHKLILNDLDALSPEQAQKIRFSLRRSVEALYPTLVALKPALGTQKHLQFPTAMMFVGMINWTHTWYAEPAKDGDAKQSEMPVPAFASLLCQTFLDGYLTKAPSSNPPSSPSAG